MTLSLIRPTRCYFFFQNRARILGLGRLLASLDPLGGDACFLTIQRCVISHLGQCKVCNSNPG